MATVIEPTENARRVGQVMGPFRAESPRFPDGTLKTGQYKPRFSGRYWVVRCHENSMLHDVKFSSRGLAVLFWNSLRPAVEG